MTFTKRKPLGQIDLVEFLERDVYPALFLRLDSAFPEFSFQHKGAYWKATNRDFTKAQFNARPDRVMAYENSPFGFQVQGADFVPWISYLSHGNTPQGKDFIEATRKLADLAGVSFPEHEWTPDQSETINIRERRGSLLETFLDKTKKALLSDGEAQSARDYLVSKRGFDDSSLLTLEFGFYSNPDTISKVLLKAGYSAAEIQNSGLTFDGRWTGRLVLPLRDPHGRITTIAARDLTGKAEEQDKYLYLKGGEKPLLFGLHKALRSAESRQFLIIVEGLLDAVSLPIKGIQNVAAIGGDGRQLSPEKWERLFNLGIRQVVLALDNDNAGKSGLLAAVDKVQNSPNVPYVYVLDPNHLGDSKDPDEYVRKHGGQCLKDLLAKRIPASLYRGTTYLEGITAESDIHARREALEKIIEHISTLRGARAGIDQEDILRLTAERTGYTYAAIADLLESHQERRQREDSEKKLAVCLRETQEGLQRRQDVFSLAHDLIQAASSIHQRPLDQPPPFSVDRLEKESRDIPPGLSSGWKRLDEADVFFNPGELSVIAARTGHCKTSFLVALLINWLQNTESDAIDTRYLFYSLEEPEVRIYHRLLAFLTKKSELNKPWTINEIRDFYRGTSRPAWPEPPNNPAALNQAKDTLRCLENRILVVFRPGWTINDICNHAAHIKKSESATAILVDYLQRIPPPAKSYERRDIEISVLGRRLKKLAVDLSTPVVVGAQINRESIPQGYRDRLSGLSYNDAKKVIQTTRPELHHLREGGSEQEADLVLGLLNYAADYRGEAHLPESTRLEVGVLKNRYGTPGRWERLSFTGRYGLIVDPEGEDI